MFVVQNVLRRNYISPEESLPNLILTILFPPQYSYSLPIVVAKKTEGKFTYPRAQLEKESPQTTCRSLRAAQRPSHHHRQRGSGALKPLPAQLPENDPEPPSTPS